MARVTVSVNVRDMTGADLARLRGRFNGLTDSLNRFAGDRSQQNLDDMRRQFRDMDSDVRSLAGRIPDDEFNRLSQRVREFGNEIRTATGPQTTQQFGTMRQHLRDINRDLDRFEGGSAGRTIRIRAEDDTEDGLSSVNRRLIRFVTGPLRGIGGMISGTLSDGIGQGIVEAAKSPVVLAAVLSLGTILVSVLSAAIAGATVLALGGVFAALGVMIALEADGVKQKWKDTLSELKPLFEDAAKPMIPVIDHARQKFAEIATEFAPHFKQAMAEAAPFMQSFLDSMKAGLQELGQNAWDDLQEGFQTFLSAFGPEWRNFLAELGNSLGALSRTVANNSGQMAIALRAVLGVINLLVDAVNFFANAWVVAMDLAIAGTAKLAFAMAMFVDQVLSVLGKLVGAAAASFGWIPGIGPKLEKARDSFNQFREAAVSDLRNIAHRANEYGATLDRNNRRRKLEVDIASWTANLESAKERLRSVPPSKRAQILADISDLQRKIIAAKYQLAGLKNKTITIHYQTTGSPYPPSGGHREGRAMGGNIGRAATGGARSNMTLVGEHGPELVNLAPGSHVKSNPDTRRFFAKREEVPSTLVLQSSGRRVDDLLVEVLREAIKQRGGNPVTVLGGNTR